MPTWSSELPPNQKHMGFDLIRTPQTAPIHAIITCDKMIVCDTHYWGGRTLPCERNAAQPETSITATHCPACNDSIPFRTHAYVSAMMAKTYQHFIFECTAHAAKALAEYYQANNTLRACIIHALRPKAQRNSPVVITTNTANLTKIKLPDPPDIIKALCTIWRVPLNGVTTTTTQPGQKTPSLDPEALKRMREQPTNQPHRIALAEYMKLQKAPPRDGTPSE